MGNAKSSDSQPATPTSHSTTTPPRRQVHLHGFGDTEYPQRVQYLSSTSSSSSSNRSTISPTGTQSNDANTFSSQNAEAYRSFSLNPLNEPDSTKLRDAIAAARRRRLLDRSAEIRSAVSTNSPINPYQNQTQDFQLRNDQLRSTTETSRVKTDSPKSVSPSSATAVYESQLRARSQNAASTQSTDTAHFIHTSSAKLYQQQMEIRSQSQPAKPPTTEPEIESAAKLFAMQLSLKSQNQMDTMLASNINHFAAEAKRSKIETANMSDTTDVSGSTSKSEENNLDKTSGIESETPSDSDNLSWGTRSSDEEERSGSEDEATATRPSPMDLFTSLMPKATNEDKEIITLSSGQAVLNEKENHLRRMLNSTFLLEYLADYVIKKTATVMKVYLKDIADIEGKCQKSFIRVLQYYPGFNFEDKLMDFIESFNYVFVVDEKNNKQISVDLSAKNYVDEAFARLVKELVLFCIDEGKNDLEKVRDYVREMFQQEPFIRYANVTTEQLHALISKYPNDLHVDRHQKVHIVENLSTDNSKVTETRSAQTEVVAFFEKELQSIPGGLFFKDLPRVLSWKKPEILANLSGRNAQSIFKILSANNLFEAKDNYICLKSAKLKQPPKNITTYDNTFLKSLAYKSKDISMKPKTPGMARYDLYMDRHQTPISIKKTEDSADDTSSCCMLGTIFSLNSVQGSIWCSPGSNSKTVLVLCTLKTIINGKQVADLKKVLKVGETVVFSASSACIGGLIKWNALKLQTASDPSANKKCDICNKPKNLNNASNPTNLTNGIALNKKNIFFWNVLGKIVAIGNLFMTVSCKLSRKSTKQNMNVFCDSATLLLDSEGNTLNDFTHFALEQMVECDIIIISVNNELVWAATEVRKFPINYSRLYQNQKLAYNCEGMVQYHQQGAGKVIVMKSQTNKTMDCETAIYERNKVWFLKNDFPPASFDSRLRALDKIIFDAVQGADGKWRVHLIRKTMRPLPNLPVPEASPLIGENTIEKLQNLNEFHVREMNEVRSSLNKTYDLTSKFPFKDDNTNTSSSKIPAATQTISTGPIVTVLGSVQNTL